MPGRALSAFAINIGCISVGSAHPAKLLDSSANERKYLKKIDYPLIMAI